MLLLVVFVLTAVLFTMWSRFWFPYVARFDNKNKDVLKNTFFMAVKNIQWSLAVILILLVEGIVYFFAPIMLLFLPAGFMLVTNLVLEKVFVQYMHPEDLEAEAQRNGKECFDI